MSFCIRCGTPYADATTPSCMRCGAPRDGYAPPPPPPVAPGWPGRREVRLGPTVLPVWLLALLLAALVVGGVGAVLLDSSPGQRPTATSVLPADAATDTSTDTPTDTPTDSPTDTPTDSANADPSAVVQQYYTDLNAGDYQDAWTLGARNITNESYDQWVAGFSSTRDIAVSASDDASTSGQVDVVITATQSDGSVNSYAGTYTVSAGVITAASIHQQ